MSPNSVNLDFEKADFGIPAEGLKCASCSKDLRLSYFEVNSIPVCAECRVLVADSEKPAGGARRFVLATLFGVFGGAAGAALWYAVAKLFNLELGLIAIVVGWLVGAGVHKGSEGRGGIRYQFLAVFVTYTSIVSTYVPLIIEALGSRTALPSLVPLVLILYAAPFLAGFKNILGILIIFFALYQAWAMNKRRILEVRGPFRVARSSAPEAPGATDTDVVPIS